VLEPGKHFQAQLLKFRPTVVYGRAVDCAQYAFGHIGGSGDLQKMTAGGVSHGKLR
jgi:hypothetical protein